MAHGGSGLDPSLKVGMSPGDPDKGVPLPDNPDKVRLEQKWGGSSPTLPKGLPPPNKGYTPTGEGIPFSGDSPGLGEGKGEGKGQGARQSQARPGRARRGEDRDGAAQNDLGKVGRFGMKRGLHPRQRSNSPQKASPLHNSTCCMSHMLRFVRS